MKNVYIPLLFLLAACGEKSTNESYSKEQPKKDSISANKKVPIRLQQQVKDTIVKNNDTTYIIGSFLFCAAKGMKFDVISKKHPSKTRISKGDTLFDDKDTLILADYKGISKAPASMNFLMGDSTSLEGVYKKYNLKFKFSMFNISDVYKGKLASPDFKSDPGSRYYKAMINQNGYLNTDSAEQNNKVNFAGHYTIIEWGKQGETQFIAIVDRISGKVYHKFPFGVFDWYFGTKYTNNSRMLIVNSDLLEIYPGYCLQHDRSSDYRYYRPAVYIWNDSIFKRIE